MRLTDLYPDACALCARTGQRVTLRQPGLWSKITAAGMGLQSEWLHLAYYLVLYFQGIGGQMRPRTIISGIVIIGMMAFYMVLLEYRSSPDNEWESRHDCRRLHLFHIVSALNAYLDNNNEMPRDFYELIAKGFIDRFHLVCPSQYASVEKSDLLDESSTVLVSSYRYIVRERKYEEIPDGTAVVEEMTGNHPSAYLGDVHYPSGYHVIMKTSKGFQVQFIEDGS